MKNYYRFQRVAALLCFSLFTFHFSLLYAQVAKDTTISDSTMGGKLKEVVIDATRANAQTPTAYTNIDKAYLAQSNLGQDLPFLLDLTPSMVTTSDAGTGVGYTYIHLRGSDATRVNVTIDGVPINDAEDQSMYWVDIPDLVSSTDNIQIQRGVGTSANGEGAFGGSINIQTTTLSPQPYSEISSSYGSFNTVKNTFNFGTGMLDGHWSFDGRASKITSDGYIDRATANLESAFLSGGYYSKKTILKLIVFTGKEKTYQAWYGVPQDSLATNRTFNPAGLYRVNGQVEYYPNETDNYEQDYYQLHLSQEIGSRWNLNVALFQTNGVGYYANFDTNYTYSHFGLSNVTNGTNTITQGNFAEQLWLNNNFYGTTYSLSYTDHSKLQISLGGSWNQYFGEHYNILTWAQYGGIPSDNYTYVGNNDLKTEYNIFIRANYQIAAKLNLFGDLQYRHINYQFPGDSDILQTFKNYDAKLDFFNPKGGISYDLSSSQDLYFSVAVGNKEPGWTDYVQSSPTSRPLPEHLTDYELGYKQNWKMAAFQVNLYYMDYINQLVLNGQINNVGDYNRINVPQSYRTGIEIIGAVQPAKWFKWEANATYSVNKIKNFNEYVDVYDSAGNYVTNQYYKTHSLSDISFSPDWIFNSILTFIPVKNVSLGILSKYVSSQFLDNTSSADRMMPAYFVNNFRVNYAVYPVKSFLKEVDFNILLNNIFNVKYVSNGYTYEYLQQNTNTIYSENNYFPQATFNVLGGVNLKF